MGFFVCFSFYFHFLYLRRGSLLGIRVVILCFFALASLPQWSCLSWWFEFSSFLEQISMQSPRRSWTSLDCFGRHMKKIASRLNWTRKRLKRRLEWSKQKQPTIRRRAQQKRSLIWAFCLCLDKISPRAQRSHEASARFQHDNVLSWKMRSIQDHMWDPQSFVQTKLPPTPCRWLWLDSTVRCVWSKTSHFPQRRKRWFCAVQSGTQACKFSSIKPRKYAGSDRPLFLVKTMLAFVRMLISKQKPLRTAKYRKHNVPFNLVQSSNRQSRQVTLFSCTFLSPNSFFRPRLDSWVDSTTRH